MRPEDPNTPNKKTGRKSRPWAILQSD